MDLRGSVNFAAYRLSTNRTGVCKVDLIWGENVETRLGNSAHHRSEKHSNWDQYVSRRSEEISPLIGEKRDARIAIGAFAT